MLTFIDPPPPPPTSPYSCAPPDIPTRQIPVLSFLFNGVIIDPVIQYISTQMSYVMTLACEASAPCLPELLHHPHAPHPVRLL